MSDIKTGNKGFVNPVDGNKVYTMDPVLPGDPSVNDTPPDYDPGSLTVDNSVRDISKKTRVTLGTYLSKSTKGEVGPATRPNKYTIDPSTDASLPSPITTQGYPTPLGPSGNSSQFKPVLPGTVSGDYSAIQNDFKKGKGPAAVPDGNELLPTATPSDSSTQLVPNGPVDKYTAAATTPNHWQTGGAGFSGGSDVSDPQKDFDVSLQSANLSGLPSVVVSTQASYGLDLPARVEWADKATDQNAIDPIPTSTLNLSSLTTNQVPTPLAPTQHGFAPNLPSSFSSDYAAADLTGEKGLQKGKTAVSGPDGNEFTAKVEIAAQQIKNPEKLAKYTDEAVSPNRFKANVSGVGFSSSAEIDSPPKEFNVPLQSVATAVMPNEEATSPTNASYDLDLSALTAVPSSLTADNTYPVVQPSLTPPYSTQTPLGFPAPLTPPVNQNSDSNGPQIHDPNLQPTFTPLGVKKGKTSDDSFLDGHTLLSDSIEEQNGNVNLPVPIQPYSTQKLSDNNEFLPTTPLVSPEIDPSAPPDFYQVRLLEIDAKGEFVEADKKAVLLNDLRKVPSEITTRNSFPITDDLPPLSPTTDKATGLPSPLIPVAASDPDSYYVPRKDIKPLSSDPSIQNLSKGKSQVAAKYDGDNLLLKLKGNKSVGEPGDKYLIEGDGLPNEGSRGGFKNNFDQPDNPAFTYKGGAGSVLSSNRFVTLGAGGMPEAGFNPKYTLSTGQEVSALQFAQIGAGLSQRASAEVPGFSNGVLGGSGGKFDPNGSLAEIGAILPSANQLGILKVDDLLLSAKDTLESIGAEFPEGSLTQIAPFGGQSWGNLTNVSEPYDDAFSLGLFITTLLMIIALKLLFAFFTLLATEDRQVKKDATGRYQLGKHKFKEPSNIFGLSFLPSWYELFGINPTQNPFAAALDAGCNAYFVGAEHFDAGVGEFLAAVIGLGDLFEDDRRMYTALVTCRTIVRSAFLLAVALDKIVRSPNVATGIKAALSIFRILRASKFVTAMNVFSSLGDTLLLNASQTAVIVGPDGENMATSLKFSGPADAYSNSSVVKHRIGSSAPDIYDPTLSWSSQRSPSLYLLNRTISAVQLSDHSNNLGSFKGMQALDFSVSPASGNPRAKNVGVISDSARIPGDVRKKLEDLLEAEYVPFYFHDVRTNEVISFHAFLASLSDGFSASYDSVEGFGRVEPIKVYKGTTRKIDMSFYVASTSPADFDHMWHKLNKLTTMVYPQYTRGRPAIGQDYNFTVPFSQLIGASPMIRIRLGDLLRSNYSRFAVARLFGLTDGDSNVLGSDGKPVAVNVESLNVSSLEEKQKKQDERLSIFKVGDEVRVFDTSVFDKTPQGQSTPVRELYADSLLESISAETQDGADLAQIAVIKNILNNKLTNKTKFEVSYSNEQEKWVNLIISAGDDAVRSAGLRVVPTQVTAAEIYNVPWSAIRLTANSKTKIRKEANASPGYDAIDNFLKPENNAITKSFESAGGRGLAGFIESMQFDWYSSTTWEVQPGSTAPKMCKVTVSFAPVHDVTPGIDHRGYNRAPIYPVGDANRSAPSPEPPKTSS